VNDLFRQGAFKGRSAREAYFVRCDRGTMTQADIDRGIVNAVIGVAPLRPSEFVIVQIRQIVGQHRHTRSRRTP
jgi:phage tail sheath protein FI